MEATRRLGPSVITRFLFTPPRLMGLLRVYVCVCVTINGDLRFTSEKISAERFILIFHFDFNPPV